MRRNSLKSKRATVFFLALLIIGMTSQTVLSQVTYQEAPMLAERVANGDLPPLEERLPSAPLVVEPFDVVGTYGGEIRYSGSIDDIVTFIGWEFMMRWEPDMSGVYPNIIESYEVNEDATVYTFHLRPGMRWSDGVPFTADDIVFAINDIFLNPELNAVPPTNLVIDGEPVVVEKVDDYTVTFTFAGSYGLFPESLAWWPAWQSTFFPKHWLTPYHMDYDPENVEAILASIEDYPELGNAGVETWVQLFNFYSNSQPWAYLQYEVQYDRPTLFPWIVTEMDEARSILTLERNPYYWKVDTEGNQLPYIDRVVLTIFEEAADEVKLLGLLSGQYDTTKDPPQEDYALFADSQFTSGLQLYDVASDGAGILSVSFNMTTVDEQKAAIFSELDFRIGVSHAINRRQIITLIYDGVGTPRQIAPVPSSPLYNEQLENQYLEFDPDLANEYLDRVLPNKDDAGYRLMPDGNRLVVTFTIADSFGLGYPQVAELLVQHLDAVGIEAHINLVGGLQDVGSGNNIEATLFTAEGGSGITAMLEPRWYVPITDASYYATGWASWHIDPDRVSAVEPPEYVKNQIQLYNQVISNPDPDERIRLMQDVIQVAADEFYVIGISSAPNRYWLISERIDNLPEFWFDGWIPGMQSATSPFQWYFTD